MTERAFLETHGLAEYVPAFEARHVMLSDLAHISDEELRVEFGMAPYVDRKRFRSAVAALAAGDESLGGATRVGGSAPGGAALAGATRVGGSAPGGAALAGATRVGVTPGSSDASVSAPYGFPAQLGSYRIVGPVGAGGMGVVVRARHIEEGWATRQGGDVAIKFVHPHLAADTTFRERFLAEADLGRRMQHPALAPTWEVIAEGAWLGTVMSFIDGEPLTASVRLDGTPVADLVRLLRPIGAALDYLHARGVVHRDVKPANVLVRPDGRPVLLDLGVAKDSSAGEGHTRTSTAVGTSAWMAPEQADAKHVDGAADRYAFGLMAYVLLAGRMPWGADTSEARVLVVKMTGQLLPIAEACPRLPAHVASAVTRMVALAPDERFPSCEAFLDAIAVVETTAATVLAGGSTTVAVAPALVASAPVAAPGPEGPHTPPRMPPTEPGHPGSRPAESHAGSAPVFQGLGGDEAAARSGVLRWVLRWVLGACAAVAIAAGAYRASGVGSGTSAVDDARATQGGGAAPPVACAADAWVGEYQLTTLVTHAFRGNTGVNGFYTLSLSRTGDCGRVALRVQKLGYGAGVMSVTSKLAGEGVLAVSADPVASTDMDTRNGRELIRMRFSFRRSGEGELDGMWRYLGQSWTATGLWGVLRASVRERPVPRSAAVLSADTRASFDACRSVPAEGPSCLPPP